MTHEQVDTIEAKLRAAQELVEEAGAILSPVSGEDAQMTWTFVNSTANDIDDIIFGLWRLRPEDINTDEGGAE